MLSDVGGVLAVVALLVPVGAAPCRGTPVSNGIPNGVDAFNWGTPDSRIHALIVLALLECCTCCGCCVRLGMLIHNCISCDVAAGCGAVVGVVVVVVGVTVAAPDGVLSNRPNGSSREELAAADDDEAAGVDDDATQDGNTDCTSPFAAAGGGGGGGGAREDAAAQGSSTQIGSVGDG